MSMGLNCFVAVRAQAVSGSMVLSEVLPGSTDSQSNEFIELYNNSDQPVALSGWTAEYKSATGKSWSKRATLAQSDSVQGHEYIVLSTEATDSLRLSSGMAQGGGNVRLRDASGNVVDQLAWGDGDSAEDQSVSAPPLGQSMARALSGDTTLLVDSDNNASDFHIATAPTPGASPINDQVPVPVVLPPGSTGGDVILSELLPDPQSPLSDTKDEYIELYNQGDSDASLEGWSLRDKTGHIYRFGPLSIPANSYMVFKSAITKISLNNDGDEISLLDASDVVVDSSPNYGSAKPGLTWGVSDGVWAWLSEPTPGSSNAAPLPPEAQAAAKATSKKTTTKSPTKKSSASAKKAKKTSAIAKKASAASPTSYAATEVAQNPKLWSWLLIFLGLGTIGYGIYAYRPEITHIIHQLRAKLGHR